MMRIVLTFVLFISVAGICQDKKIDKLEILYDQGYYKKVYRKANSLLADPLYDYSALPEYYKSLAIFRLAMDDLWFKRHPKCIFEAIDLFKEVEESEKYGDYVAAHIYELQALKGYLSTLQEKLKGRGLAGSAEALEIFISDNLGAIKVTKIVVEEPEIIVENEGGNESNIPKSVREKMVVYAKSLVGVKYVWAGNDESGFDCSGFTSYVHKKYGILISRTASGQQEESKKVKLDHAQKADLVFFGNGAKITHVGLVVSNKGDELSMVHASTSKGVIITNIEKSTYWKPKLKSAGTYVDA